MRAWLLDKPGGTPAQLRKGEAPEPQPGPGDIKVEVKAAGFNPVDWKILAGPGHPAWAWPHVPGLDAAGIVTACGAGVETFKPGDRVAFHGDLRRPGAYAAFTLTAADAAARIPDKVDFAQAAAVPCAGYTAWHALFDRLRLQKGQTVLITAGNGGVGSFAIQLARHAGATVLTTASKANHDHLRKLGADHVIDYAGDVPAQVREILNGRPLHAVLDLVSPASAESLLPLVTYAGGIATVAGRIASNTAPPFTTSPSLHEVALGAAYSHGAAEHRRRLGFYGEELLGMIAAGVIDPIITSTVGFDDIPQALEAVKQGRTRGKTVAVFS